MHALPSAFCTIVLLLDRVTATRQPLWKGARRYPPCPHTPGHTCSCGGHHIKVALLECHVVNTDIRRALEIHQCQQLDLGAAAMSPECLAALALPHQKPRVLVPVHLAHLEGPASLSQRDTDTTLSCVAMTLCLPGQLSAASGVICDTDG